MKALIGTLVGAIALGALAVSMQESDNSPPANPPQAHSRAEKSKQMDAAVERERKERAEKWAATPKPRDAFEERAWMVAECVRTNGHGRMLVVDGATDLAVKCANRVDRYLSGETRIRPDGSR
jgi:pyruvate/2-oxoglutarate dehydrogenase complex dihydrolipoamide acyltransferase (E2) component